MFQLDQPIPARRAHVSSAIKYVLVEEQRRGMRGSNQDHLLHDATAQALLLVVADGMGGYQGGELAAEIAAGSLCHSFAIEAKPQIDDPQRFLERAIARAHAAIRQYAGDRDLPEVPRTVMVACVVQDGRAWWNHVGDTRLYLVRDGRIEAQTRDHSAVQPLVDAGTVPAEKAYGHPDSNRMLQSLGAPSAPEPGPGASAQLRKNDILLLCSDGFWGPLGSKRLLRGLGSLSLRRSILELADTAERRAGAHADNLTVLALAWQDENPSSVSRDSNQPEADSATRLKGTDR